MTPSLYSSALAALQAEVDLTRRALRAGGSIAATTAAGQAAPGALPTTAQERPTHQVIDVSGAADHVVIQGAQGVSINIFSLWLYVAGDDCTLQPLDGAKPLIGPLVGIKGTQGIAMNPQKEPWFELSPGESFVLHVADAAAPRVTGFVQFRLLPPSL
jgi:hypothetical protein